MPYSPVLLTVLHMRAAGDWLQGPYVYALYQHYGFDRGDIGRLFIAGFGSSMIFGTIVGSLADKTCACCIVARQLWQHLRASTHCIVHFE